MISLVFLLFSVQSATADSENEGEAERRQSERRASKKKDKKDKSAKRSGSARKLKTHTQDEAEGGEQAGEAIEMSAVAVDHEHETSPTVD